MSGYTVENNQSDLEARLAMIEETMATPGYKLLKAVAEEKLLGLGKRLADVSGEREALELSKEALLWSAGPRLLENLAKEVRTGLKAEDGEGLVAYKERKQRELAERKSGISDL